MYTKCDDGDTIIIYIPFVHRSYCTVSMWNSLRLVPVIGADGRVNGGGAPTYYRRVSYYHIMYT